MLISRQAYDEALEAAAKAVELSRAPDSITMARNTFALAAEYARRYDDALNASLQAVSEYRERHDGDRFEYAALLADALTDHALIRTLRAERAEAEAAIAESLAMHRELAAANPGRYQRELDRALEVAAQLG